MDIEMYDFGRDQLPSFLVGMGLTVGAEVGVFRGEFSEVFLREPGIRHLYSIDPWLDNDGRLASAIMEDCVARLWGYGARSTTIRMTSARASDEFDDGELDFVFLDGDHSYEGVRLDISCWWPVLRHDGFLMGHDFSDRGRNIMAELATASNPDRGRKGVRRAVGEFAEAQGLRVYLTSDRPHSWCIRKP